MTGPAQTVQFTAFVLINEGRWRVEVDRGGGRKISVYAYDGRSYFSNSPGLTAEHFEPTSVLKPLYAAFPSPSKMPLEDLGGIRCWRYTEKTRTTTVTAWIDTRTRLLRRLSTTGFGAPTTDTYDPLAVDIKEIAARMLHPTPMLIN